MRINKRTKRRIRLARQDRTNTAAAALAENIRHEARATTLHFAMAPESSQPASSDELVIIQPSADNRPALQARIS